MSKLLLSALLASLLLVFPAGAASFRVGVSNVHITPIESMYVMGYPDLPRMSEAQPYPVDGLGLSIRAVYIANLDYTDPVVLVACDLVNFAPFDTDYARDTASARIPNLTRERVMINLTHTHNTPSSSESSVRVMRDEFRHDAAQESTWRKDVLRPKLVEAIQKAYDNARPGDNVDDGPANLWFHRNKIDIAANRRRGMYRADLTDGAGTAMNDEDGYDQTLDVIEVFRDDGTRKATLFFYGAHPVGLGDGAFPDGKYYHHPDFPGFARKRIEDETADPNDVAIFFQAAGGDVDVIAGNYAATKTAGNALGERVLAMMAETATNPSNVITAPITPAQGASTAFSRVWGVPFQTAAGNDRLGGHGPGEPRRLKEPAPNAGAGATQNWGRWAERYCDGFTGHGGGNPRCSVKSGVDPDQAWDVELQTVSVGNWRIAGLSHEPVSVRGLHLRQRWSDDWVSVMGYIGRTQNYLPTSAQITEDDDHCMVEPKKCRDAGYEGFAAQMWNGHPSPWATYASTDGRYDIDAEIGHVLKAETPARVNYALPWHGSEATASSHLNGATNPAAANNGDRTGRDWGVDAANGSGWHDNTPDDFSNDRIVIDFNKPRTIDEIHVFSVQDSYLAPTTPLEDTKFTLHGLISFQVEIWTDSAWKLIAAPSANNLVWWKIKFPPVTASKVRVTVFNAGAGYSRVVEIEAWGDATSRPNVALASRGTTANASSELTGRTAAAAINGDRKGLHWGTDPSTGSGWHDEYQNAWPDVVEVDFGAPRRINEVNVYSVQDDLLNPVEPTPTMTFTAYGLVDFTMKYWNAATSAWDDLPGGVITGNNLVRRSITFPPLTTSKLRLVVTNGGEGHSRLVELEALSPYDFLSSVQP